MLKYIAIVAIGIIGYFYLNSSKAPSDSLPQMPKTRSTAWVPSVQRIPIAPSAPAASLAVSTAGVIDSKNKIYTYPDIQKMIVSDDVCALHKYIMDTSAKEEPPVYVDALFEALNLDSLKPLFGAEGPLFKSQEGKVLTPSQKFIDALATSAFLFGTRREQGGGEKALQQLEELTTAFPENGAYAVYKLALEQQMGKSNAHLRETAAVVAKAKTYDSGFFAVRAELHKHMWSSASLYYLTRVVSNSLPGVRLHKVRDAVAGIEDRKTIEHLGNLLVQKGLNSKRTYLSEEFDISEYYEGNAFLSNKHPDVNDLAEIKEPGKLTEVNENWVNYDLDSENCDRTALDESFQKMKNRY